MARSFRQVAAATRIQVLGSWVGENRLPGASRTPSRLPAVASSLVSRPKVRPQVHAARRGPRDRRSHSHQRLGGARAAFVEPHAHPLQHALVTSLHDDARDHAFAQLGGGQPGERLDVAQLARPAPDAPR